MRRILFTETNLNELPSPPIGYRYIGFNGSTFSVQSESGIIPTGIQGPQGPIGPTGSGGGSIVNVLTYTELTSLISSDSLETGSYYLISDFRTCYDQPDFDVYGNGITSSNTYKMAEIQPIIVLATSDNTLDSNAYQPTYPKDQIKYDISWTQSEVTGGTAYGRITERIDEFNNRTDYDHRNIRFKRYRTRLLDGTENGKILSMDNGLVIGTNSNFNGDFASGSVVFIESLNPNFYKITNIVSDTEMIVEGINYDNFNDSIGYQFQSTYLEQYYTPGTLYYFNDTGENDIDDGGNDMYDGANILNTNLQNQIPYTHTQMSGVSGQATLEDFTYDGTVEVGDSYFGEGSNYFTNTYPGLFVMAAYDVDVTNFSITGDIGADGDGDVEVSEYTLEGYKIFVKKVFNAGDPSINHIIIVNSTDELIERTYDPSSDDDDHELANLDNVTQIHYLLFGLSSGSKPTDTQIENVYQSYLNIIDNLDINVTLSNLNSDFTDITDNLPPNSVTFVSLEARQTNIADDNLVFREILTFDTDLGVDARNNYIGNACDSWQWDERDFMLPNNVFTNAFDNNVDIYDNHFGDRFVNNTFGDDVYENFVGSDFYNNMCQDRFDRNQIASDFRNNEFYRVEFESNSIGDNFSNNIFISNDNEFYDNQIGNDFTDNRFFSDSRLYENQIGDGFNSNRIHNNMRKNQIGNNFANNDIYRQIYDNTIRNNFNNNNIYNDFYDNSIDNRFENNTIGTSLTIGNSQFYKNKIGVDVKGNSFVSDAWGNVLGDNFASNAIQVGFNRNVMGIECYANIIGESFTDNHIGNYFLFNTIGNNFQHNKIGNSFDDNNIDYNFAYNEIGNYFSDNTILHDFGYGGGQSHGNKIGNYFENNTIGEYFYSNVVTDIFSNNTVGSYFKFNNVKIHNLSFYDFTLGYNNIISFTDNTGASPSIPGTDNVYTGLTVSGGSGLNATFDVTVAGSIVTDVTLNNAGTEYQINNVLTIPYQSFGGTAGFDIEITVGSVSATPHVYQNYNCDLFRNSSATYSERLSYYDSNDVLNIETLYP